MPEKYRHLIRENRISPLGSVPFHKGIPCIERLIAPDFPVHLAIHRIRDAKGLPEEYVALHKHKVPEVNILIADGEPLKYKLQLGDEVYVISSPASIWIPAGLEHAATVLEGSGYYVCLILTNTKDAFK